MKDERDQAKVAAERDAWLAAKGWTPPKGSSKPLSDFMRAAEKSALTNPVIHGLTDDLMRIEMNLDRIELEQKVIAQSERLFASATVAILSTRDPETLERISTALDALLTECNESTNAALALMADDPVGSLQAIYDGTESIIEQIEALS